MRMKPYLAAVLSAVAAVSAKCAEPDHLNTQPPPRPPYVDVQPAKGFTLPPVSPDDTIVAPGVPVGKLERVRFVGNTVVGTEDLKAIAAPFLGKAIGADDIETLRQKVSLCYVERGYVNSGAVLSAGAWDHGTLTFHIVEGRLKEIRLRGLGRLDEHYVADRLTRGDEPLNILTLGERFQLLLADPLFTRMSGQLMPGPERGTAILNVDVERARPYQLNFYANNYSPVAIGAETATVGGWIRNLTRHGDLVEASYQGPLRHGNARRKAVGWRLPINTVGTQVSLNYDEGYSSVIEQPTQQLDIESQIVTKDVGLSQVVFETLRRKFTVGINRVNRENRTTLFGQPFSFVANEPTGTSRANDWRIWQEYAHRWENQVLALRSTFTFGDNNQIDTGLPPGTTVDRRYRIWLGQAQFARRIRDDGTQVILRLAIQETSDRLISLEGMSVGGVNTVRGYRENQLVRDTGAVANVEIAIPLMAGSGNQIKLDLAPFVDYGRARNIGETAAVISSMGLATHLQWQGLVADLALARRLSHKGTTLENSSNLQDKGIHFQLSYAFF